MKKFYKKNKTLVIGIGIFVVILIVILIALWDILIPSNGSAYGNRLENMETVLPSDSVIEEIISELEGNSKVKKASFNRSGKILNFFIDVEVGTDKVSSLSYANKILEHLTDGQKTYFDIQVYFTCETEQLGEDDKSIYPFIAYKHRTSTVFVVGNTD